MLTFKCVENSSFASSFYAVKGTDQSKIIARFMKVISTSEYVMTSHEIVYINIRFISRRNWIYNGWWNYDRCYSRNIYNYICQFEDWF